MVKLALSQPTARPPRPPRPDAVPTHWVSGHLPRGRPISPPMLDLRLTRARVTCVAGVRPASLQQGGRSDRSRASACRNRVDGRRYARWAVRAAVGADMTLQAARSATYWASHGPGGL